MGRVGKGVGAGRERKDNRGVEVRIYFKGGNC